MRLDKTAQSVTCLWRQTVLCAAFCLTNSTEHERSWEATSSSSRPATPPLSQQIYVIRRISTYTQEPTILSVLSQINLVNTLPCPFNIFLHLLLVLSSCLCTAPFPTNPCTSLLQNTILKHWTSPRIQQMRFAILTPFFLSSRKPSRFIKYATSYCCKINFFSVANRFIPTKCCQTASNTISCQHSSQYHLLSTHLSIPSPHLPNKKSPVKRTVGFQAKAIANRIANLLQLLCIQLRKITSISHCSHTKDAA